MFDFAEALNPNNSLSDIMADIMSDLSSKNTVEYSKENIDSFISKLDEDDIKELESGVMTKPNIKRIQEDEEIEVSKNKLTNVHKKGILRENNLFSDIKK